MEKLVTAEWLNQNLGQHDIIILDCSVGTNQTDDGKTEYLSGKKSFDNGHIPTARLADLTSDLADTESPLMFALPSPEEFCAQMRKLGVNENSRVVLYDRSFTAWAARVWWMLRWIGFDKAALLDGGLNAWEAKGFQTTSKPTDPIEGDVSLNLRSNAIAEQNDIRSACSTDDGQLIDTLSAASFNGEDNAFGRAGHIKGASNTFALDLFDENGHFRSLDELVAMHNGDKSKRYITYCGAGILASVNAFTMVRLGYEDVSVYAASLQEWVRDETNLMQTAID